MSKRKEREEHNPVGRFIDKIEDAVEDIVKPEEHEEHHEHHHQHTQHRHSDDRANITINVHVDCCPPTKGKCDDGSNQPGTTGGRPTHTTGTSDGSVKGGFGAPGAVIKIPRRPPNVWPGTRTQLATCPILFIRAKPGDLGARPVVGTFWESPDIFIEPGVAPSAAPALPSTLGGVAKANADNTVYAHVWNLGQAPAIQALVEFYWFNPSLGFKEGEQNLIGFAMVDLAGRGSSGSHKVVKCPASWKATYENGGHECLVVRVSQLPSDPLSSPAWDACQNRHIGQRNIHVMTAAEAAALPTIGINVGPLFGQPAQVTVARADTGTMPWLHLATNSRTVLPGTGAPTGDVGISPPIPVGGGLPNLGAVPNARGAGLIGDGHGVTGDGMQVGFVTTDGNPGNGNAHVYRVSGSQNGQTFGGYTVVILGG